MVKSYGQYCPVARASEILTQRWTLLILRDVLGGARRFNEIRKGVPRMSPTLLSERLKALEGYGLLIRGRSAETGYPEYEPTQAAREIWPVIELLGVWGQRWVRDVYEDDPLDIGLLMWDLQCRIDPARFPPGRTVVHFEFRPPPKVKYMLWWLIVDDDVDLCVTDPGYDVDLTIVTDIRTMTKVWMGDVPVRSAIRDDALELHGSSQLAGNIERWLPLSYFARTARPPEPLDLDRLLVRDTKATA